MSKYSGIPLLHSPSFDKPLRRPLKVLDVMLCILLLVTAFTPMGLANAADVERCSAKPNSDSTSSEILGGKETRITLEIQAGDDEEINAIEFTLPEGSTFSAANSRVTILEKETGSATELANRVELENATFVGEEETLYVDFGENAPAGAYIRLEVYGVLFPYKGGEMQCTSTYTTADGTVHELEGIPAIQVVGVSASNQFSSWLSDQPWVEKWNSNKFLRLFFNPPILVSSFPIVLKGFFMAIAIVAVSFPLAIPIGLLLALMRISKLRILRAIASVYVNVVRGTPLFLQIYIAFFGLPLAGIQIPNFPLGVIVLAMNSAAYQCEIMRAGIQSIPKGQTQAARSLGMNGMQTMFSVIIPQTIRRIIPTMTNEFILLYKDTSMLAAVGVMEVVMYAKTIVANTGSITPYIVAAVFYLIITLPLSRVVTILERKLAGSEAGTNKKRRKSRNSFGFDEIEGSTALPDGMAGDENRGETRSPHVARTVDKPAEVGVKPEEGSSL